MSRPKPTYLQTLTLLLSTKSVFLENCASSFRLRYPPLSPLDKEPFSPRSGMQCFAACGYLPIARELVCSPSSLSTQHELYSDIKSSVLANLVVATARENISKDVTYLFPLQSERVISTVVRWWPTSVHRLLATGKVNVCPKIHSPGHADVHGSCGICTHWLFNYWISWVPELLTTDLALYYRPISIDH